MKNLIKELVASLLIIIFLATLLYLIFEFPFYFLAGLVLLVFATLIFGGNFHQKHLKQLARERQRENFDTFAQEFDQNGEIYDRALLRATWEALSPYFNYGEGFVPLRASDRLECFVFDTFELQNSLLKICEQMGRTMKLSENKDLYDYTIRDLINCMKLQSPIAIELPWNLAPKFENYGK